jgi:hypothetical protein
MVIVARVTTGIIVKVVATQATAMRQAPAPAVAAVLEHNANQVKRILMSTGYGHKLLTGMLFVSILTNIILVTRLHFPQFFQQLRLVFVVPPRLEPSDHRRGPGAADTVVIVYTNYECFYCAELNRNLLALMSELDFQIVYRHFSDPVNRPLSFKAAWAAECAGEQNRFWEYNDRLFQPGQAFDSIGLSDIAGQLQLNTGQFQTCLADETYAGRISAQTKNAQAKKVIATPTFFVNGKRFEGVRPLDEMSQLLAASNKSQPL